MMANDLAPPCLASTSLSAAAAKGFCIASQPASQPSAILPSDASPYVFDWRRLPSRGH
jgi:hypothetical protein